MSKKEIRRMSCRYTEIKCDKCFTVMLYDICRFYEDIKNDLIAKGWAIHTIPTSNGVYQK